MSKNVMLFMRKTKVIWTLKLSSLNVQTSRTRQCEVDSIHVFKGYGSRDCASALQTRPNARLKHVSKGVVQTSRTRHLSWTQFMCSKGMGLGTAQVLSRRGQMSVGSMFRLRYLDERHGLTLDIGGPRFWTTNGSFSRLGIFFYHEILKKGVFSGKKMGSSGLNATRARNASKRGPKMVAAAISKCSAQILLL